VPGWVFADDGQSLVEVALALPLLLLLVLGTVDVGRIYALQVAATNAAREAAIHAARDPQVAADDICARARSELGADPSASPCATAPITVPCARAGTPGSNDAGPILYQTPGEAGADVTVTVSCQLDLVSTYLVGRAFRLNPVIVTGTATFVGLGE